MGRFLFLVAVSLEIIRDCGMMRPMSQFFKSVCIVLMVSGLTLSSSRASANEMKAFIMSCTYGVLAGTLVGAATLAFEDQPGENLNKVARGASLGLYAGILLGVYVTQIVPSQADDEVYPTDPEVQESSGTEGEEAKVRFQVFPLTSHRGLEGVGTQLQILSF